MLCAYCAVFDDQTERHTARRNEIDATDAPIVVCAATTYAYSLPLCQLCSHTSDQNLSASTG